MASPAVAAQALRPDLDHTHDEFDRAVRIELNDVAVSGGTSTGLPPFGRTSSSASDPSGALFRAWDLQRRRHPAFFERASYVPLPPALLASGTLT